MPDRIAEIRARLDAATPGPWQVSRDGGDWGSVHTGEPHDNVVTIYSSDDDGHKGDQAFIAHAPADIAYLLDALEHERKETLRLFARLVSEPESTPPWWETVEIPSEEDDDA